MKILILALLASSTLGMVVKQNEWDKDWYLWKKQYDKSYVDEEEASRREIWESNLRRVIKHNYEYDLGKHTYTLGMNSFADMTNKEFKAIYLSERLSGETKCNEMASFQNVADMPATTDWRTKGYVTAVKNQGQCGSCWAFSTTGSIEGQHFKKTGNLVSLSEQNLVDCSDSYGNDGCGGGWMDNAFKYVIANGVDTEKSYPYKAEDGTCKYNKDHVGARISGCRDISSKNETALEVAVATVGPISVGIDAGHESFQLYKSGVYYEENCSENMLDHGVLVVGYGTDNGKDYWLVKNSWGTEWGMEGYIKNVQKSK